MIAVLNHCFAFLFSPSPSISFSFSFAFSFSAGGLARKRPLLGVPRSSMNPTKRTVMTLLARAKNSQALHAVRNPIAAATAARFAE